MMSFCLEIRAILLVVVVVVVVVSKGGLNVGNPTKGEKQTYSPLFPGNGLFCVAIAMNSKS